MACMFEGKGISNNMMQASVMAIRNSLQDAYARFGTANGEKRILRETKAKWKPPPTGWIKVNTDGAHSHTSPGVACGGVFRDEHGNFLEGFMFKGDDGDSLTAELWGCLHGLKLAWDHGYRSVILETDATEVMELLKQEINVLHADCALIEEIQQLLGRDWLIELSHTRRWNNNVADHLAKTSLSAMPGLHVLRSADTCLERLLLLDKT